MWQCLESWLLWFYQLVKDWPWLTDMIFSPRLRWALTALLAASKTARTESLADIDHVILFMQENRAFDHYFGTMPGVRGFADPNVQYNNGIPVWKQQVTPQQSKDTDYITPWYINYLGGTWPEATQCMSAGSNGWDANQAAWNHGANNQWAVKNTPYSIGYYKRDDLPVHFALAEEWTVGDMYQESVIASTNPNRVMWISGSINVPGSPQTKDEGGYPYIDNNETPGCDKNGINCYPLKWSTAAEKYEAAGVSWSVFQDADNFDDNPYAWFEQFQDSKTGSDLNKKGMKGQSLDAFYAQAAAGTLPEVSYIVGPMQLSEHPPYSPHDGSWLQRKVAEAVINSPKYSKSVLIISYDETGGWADHVSPYTSPDGTAGEWIDDPYGAAGRTATGPGFRVPFYIISPFTRKGGVYTEHADHTSQVSFIEKWQAAKGRDVTTDEMVPWRRENMADLVNAFDFKNPDYSIPNLPEAPQPHTNSKGVYDGSSYCSSQYGNGRPPVPYTGVGVNNDTASLAEAGFKPVRGLLTEGRTLVIESSGQAVSATSYSSKVSLSKASKNHDNIQHGWVLHAVDIGGDQFTISSANNGQYICKNLKLCKDSGSATVFVVDFKPSKGHSFKDQKSGEYLASGRKEKLGWQKNQTFWKVFSVTY
ncbi:related to non-hemolytic phospholipase C precursor [Fusarium fujikuroi]|nr:related to non-hemolytic phospholipase C precursor [Fusarium fujikuroi]SCV51928.1 related to non-hemolytic phospholipase C precursor [Fusarium fujikuroi]